MRIIPVIDVLNGIVIHAKQGNRKDYSPLQSTLCQSADAFAVIDAFRKHFKPDCIYIADLNAITRQCSNADLVKAVLTAYPEITFWVDAGYPLPDVDFLNYSNFVPVLGSESFQDDTIDKLKQFGSAYILSLDFSAASELGAKALFSQPEVWPQRIIIMSLPRVGSNLGPDLERLEAYRNRYPQHTIIAGGGVRNLDDLAELEKLDVHSALLATALHSGQINPDDFSNAQAKKYPG